MALDSANNIFTLFGVLGNDPKKFKWTRHWGAPFRIASGMRVPLANDGIAFSYLSPNEDWYYQAPNGNKYDVGKGVTNVFFLGESGQHITYLDPWLPNDFSYQVGGPVHGRFRSVGLSASGSTLFIINRTGDMYTINYDFDLAGADDFFFNYSYDKKDYTVKDTSEVLPRKVPRPLPLPGWKRQPKINGVITDRITIFKVGAGVLRRTLRVEGRDSLGRTGFFTKDISEPSWQFVETGLPLKGTPLENPPGDRSDSSLGPDESMKFRGMAGGMEIEVPDFHPYCPPATVKLTLKAGVTLTLPLHYHETLRQLRREKGVTDKPLSLKGAIELPSAFISGVEKLDPPVREFIARVLDGAVFTEVEITVTLSALTLKAPKKFDWRLSRVSP